MRKRVNLSLDEDTYTILLEYATVLETTPTRVIHQVLNEVLPTFKSLTKIAQQAHEDRSQAIVDLQSFAISKIASVSHEASLLGSSEEQMELLDDND